MKTTGNNITKDENPFESLHNLVEVPSLKLK